MAESLNFAILENKTKLIPLYKEGKMPGKRWISYGEKNDYPNYLYELYLKSTVLQSIIEGIIDYVCGSGVRTITHFEESVNQDGDTLEDLCKKLLVDYLAIGGFAINVLRDAEDRVSELYWVDIRNIRLSEDSKTAFYAENINGWGVKPEELPVFDRDVKHKSSIYYYKGHISRGLYPIPRWSGAVTAVETSTEISKYHLNSILNNFTPSALISFNNGVPDKATQEAIEKRINNKFVGSDNVNRFILSFSENGENATTIQRLDSDHTDEKFGSLKDSIFEEIFIAFRSSPELFGMRKEGNGFNKQEYLEAFSLFNKTLIQPIQKDLERVFDRIFDIKGAVKFNKYTVYDETIITDDEKIESENENIID